MQDNLLTYEEEISDKWNVVVQTDAGNTIRWTCEQRQSFWEYGNQIAAFI